MSFTIKTDSNIKTDNEALNFTNVKLCF